MNHPSFQTYNDALFLTLAPFIVATPGAFRAIDPAPFGLATRWHIDPLVMKNGAFFRLLQRLDQLTFGPAGMPMERWVFYEGAELPGAIYGLALEASALNAAERATLEVPPSYTGPVPFAMYIAIPMRTAVGPRRAVCAGRRTFFGHNLASLNRVFPERRLGHLGSITKALALAAFRVERQVGATQWASSALFIHTKFGPLELLTAWTPAHSISMTLTYAFDVTDRSLRAAAGDPSVVLARPEPDRFLVADDEVGMQALQAEIEAGQRFVLAGPSQLHEGRRRHPISRQVDSR